MSLLLALQERTIEGSVTGLIGNTSGEVSFFYIEGSVAGLIGIPSGEINFTGATPIPGAQIRTLTTGGGAWDEAYIKRRRQQLAKDDEEIMIFVKAFLTHHGTD